MISCELCRSLLNDSGLKNAAAAVEQRFPECICERFSVGDGSPGPIEDNEVLYRMFTDPIDVDEGTGEVARDAFEQAYKDGLSIIRERATDDEVEALVRDILSVKPDKQRRTILAIFEFRCSIIRQETCDFRSVEHKAFCVYDQTVPQRLNLGDPAVPTHGTVMSRRLYELPVTKRQFQNDCNATLHKIITPVRREVQTFRNGLIAQLNARSLAGEFVRAA